MITVNVSKDKLDRIKQLATEGNDPVGFSVDILTEDGLTMPQLGALRQIFGEKASLVAAGDASTPETKQAAISKLIADLSDSQEIDGDAALECLRREPLTEAHIARLAQLLKKFEGI